MPEDIYETLLLEASSDGTLVVKINRPHAANAINTQLGSDLLKVFQGLQTAGEYRSVVLTGAYNRLVNTADRREGIRAFVEKRKPQFTGTQA